MTASDPHGSIERGPVLLDRQRGQDQHEQRHWRRKHGSVELARYIVRATGASGPVEFQQRLTIDKALEKARELRDAHFSHITIFNVLTGVEIADLEALMGEAESERPPGETIR